MVSKLYHYRSVCCYTVRRQCTVMYATECMQEFLTNPWEDEIYQGRVTNDFLAPSVNRQSIAF